MSDIDNNIKNMISTSSKVLVPLMNAIGCFLIPYYGTYLLIKYTDLSNKFLCMLALISILSYTLDIVMLILSLILHHNNILHILGQFIKDTFALGIMGLFLWVMVSVITAIISSIIDYD